MFRTSFQCGIGRTARGIGAGVVALACAIGLAGCTSAPESGQVASRDSGLDGGLGGEPANVLSAGLVGNQSGLEVQWWVVDDPQSFVGAALSKYETADTALDDATRQLLWANGLRVLAVPVGDLAEVRARLDVGTVGQTQWLGLLPTWTQVVAGPEFQGKRAINLDEGRVVLDGGKIRLLARCWAAPGAEGKGAIRLELTPQHVEQDSQRARELAALEGRTWTIEDEGLVFTRLRAGWSASGANVYMIVPESPATDWTKVAERGERSTAAREREERIASANRIGPFAGSIPTVGEAMLTSALSDPEGRIGKRIVLVLVPRLPETFQLITP